jgi:hypothetical protein
MFAVRLGGRCHLRFALLHLREVPESDVNAGGRVTLYNASNQIEVIGNEPDTYGHRF